MDISRLMAFRISNIFLGVLLLVSLRGQSPYENTLYDDLPFIAAGVGFLLKDIYIKKRVNPLTEFEISLFNRNTVNRFDRSAIDNLSGNAKKLSDVFSATKFTYPLLFLIPKKTRKDALTLGLMATEMYLVNKCITTFAKGMARRSRPFVYNPNARLVDKLDKGARLSFFSGHTSGVAAFSFFTAKVFTDYYPDSEWKPVVWTAAAILPMTTGYLRFKAGKHYPTDVIAGMISGGLIGILIPQIHKKKEADKSQKVRVSFFSENEQIGLVLVW